ncbi:putative multidrug ABC transporter permease YbhS [Alphaproteobacteria bacterium SO-S41]|nr:putative multidrug ABC transporter permease YbhS [Alphaproteobacteria bacterium SO-S41]
MTARAPSRFALARVAAVFLKELIQMRRDRFTFAIMIAMPVMQVLLFGFAINNDPRHLATAVELREDSPLSRSFLAAMKQSSFFDIVAVTHQAGEGDAMLQSGDATFLVVIPEGFEHRLVRGERPEILLAADASDPIAAGGALGALEPIAAAAFEADLDGALSNLNATPAPYQIVTQRRFNPEGETSFNIVPALLGVILTMTMVMVTSIALTRELERGTMETLLATPVQPAEIMLGKTLPYIFVGGVQTVLVLLAAFTLFHIPFTGSLLALLAGVTVFTFANLMLGYLISTVAKTQMQAMQLTFFVFLPSILLSGFMFPFRAMPNWAQWIGEALPLTHFLRLVRETILKEGGFPATSGDLLRLTIILVVLTGLALARFRKTLD